MNLPLTKFAQMMGEDCVRYALSNHDGWAYEQALRYLETGEEGPDMQPYIAFWHAETDDWPTPSLGSIRCFEEIEAGRFDPASRA
jgi:hypothetical protein